MEQRKLIRLGNSSFAVALPKDWVNSSGLKKGDNIFIERNANGEIRIMPRFRKEHEKEITLDLNGHEETMLQTELIGSYFQDYDVFRIKNNLDGAKRKHVKELVKNLMSFEIVEETKDEIKLKDVFNVNEANISGFVKRIDNITRSFFDDIALAISNGKIAKETSNEIHLADKEITKLYLLLGRIFMKSMKNSSLLSSLKIESSEIFNSWWVALHIEKIGDDLKYMAKMLEKPVKNIGETERSFSVIYKNYIDCMTSYYTRDKEKTAEIIESNKKIIMNIEEYEKSEPVIAQMSERLKSMQGNLFQISKMAFYLR